MFNKVKAVLIDLSGTIHIESNEIPGSIEALKRLKQSGLRYKFVTNTTKESQNVLYSRLKSLGFDIEKDQIFSSLIAARDLIRNERLKPHLMLEDAALEDFSEFTSTQSPNEQRFSGGEAVVVGLAPSHFDYESMNIAFQKLLDGARLIAIHQGRYYRSSKGLQLGPGPFVKALAYAADIETQNVMVVGKPSTNFFMQAIDSFEDSNLRPDEAVMIGDDVRDDIDGAQRCGMKGILVRTGKYRRDDEATIKPAPALTVTSFGEAISAILR